MTSDQALRVSSASKFALVLTTRVELLGFYVALGWLNSWHMIARSYWRQFYEAVNCTGTYNQKQRNRMTRAPETKKNEHKKNCRSWDTFYDVWPESETQTQSYAEWHLKISTHPGVCPQFTQHSLLLMTCPDSWDVEVVCCCCWNLQWACFSSCLFSCYWQDELIIWNTYFCYTVASVVVIWNANCIYVVVDRDMGARHRARPGSIQIMKVQVIPASKLKSKNLRQFVVSNCTALYQLLLFPQNITSPSWLLHWWRFECICCGIDWICIFLEVELTVDSSSAAMLHYIYCKINSVAYLLTLISIFYMFVCTNLYDDKDANKLLELVSHQKSENWILWIVSGIFRICSMLLNLRHELCNWTEILLVWFYCFVANMWCM